jgi:hypothetical protein
MRSHPDIAVQSVLCDVQNLPQNSKRETGNARVIVAGFLGPFSVAVGMEIEKVGGGHCQEARKYLGSIIS